MKLIRSAQDWRTHCMFLNKFLLLIIAVSIQGCIFPFGKPTEDPIHISTVPVEKVPLGLAEPPPLKLTAPKWVIVTPQNIDSIWKQLQDKKSVPILFAITSDGYEELSITQIEIRNLIEFQRAIILKYKEYYEPTVVK